MVWSNLGNNLGNSWDRIGEKLVIAMTSISIAVFIIPHFKSIKLTLFKQLLWQLFLFSYRKSMTDTTNSMEINQLIETFQHYYGKSEIQPRLFFAPGRVNLIGEHTDYNGGFVLPCAIGQGTYLLIRPNNLDEMRLASTNFSFRKSFRINEIPEKLPGEWTNYPMGIFDQFLREKINIPGFDILFSGDIPHSAGLSSSASIEMVTAYALTVMLNVTRFEMTDLINMSKKAENEFIGLNCGIMDMFAIGMGKKDFAIFLNCQTLEYKRVAFVLNGYKLIIVNSNKKRGLADSKYNERVAECQLAVSYLSRISPVSRLSEVGFMQYFKWQNQIPDDLIRRRARHVISENQRVLNAVPILLKGDLMQFGALMNASHESLRDNYEVTGVELDTLVEAAWKVNGCIGARMTGAGFGGCTVNIVADHAVEKFIQSVGETYTLKTGLTAEFYLAEPSDGAREIIL
jgi:galactokinase